MNFWTLVVAILVAVLLLAVAYYWNGWVALGALIPLGYGFWILLGTKLKIYELTTERIRIYEGILNQNIDEVELYRVKDIRMERPFWLRIFGLGNLHLITSDRTLPEIVIPAIGGALDVRETLRKRVEILRDRKRVREVDFEGGEDGDLENSFL